MFLEPAILAVRLLNASQSVILGTQWLPIDIGLFLGPTVDSHYYILKDR